MSQAEWLYHITTAERVPSISKVGLIPSMDPRWGGELGRTSLGKTFFGTTPDTAIYYGKLIFKLQLECFDLAHIPVLLRLPRSSISELKIDETDIDSLYTEKYVRSDKIEGFWQDKWLSLKELDFIDEEMFYKLTDEGFKDWEGNIIGDYAADAVEDVNQLLTPKIGHLRR